MGATSRSSAIISFGGVTVVDDSAFNDPVVEQLEQDYLDRNHLHIRSPFLRRWRGLDEPEFVTDFIHRKRLIGVIEGETAELDLRMLPVARLVGAPLY